MATAWWNARPEIKALAEAGEPLEVIQALIARELGMDITVRQISKRISREGWRDGVKRGRRPGQVYERIAPETDPFTWAGMVPDETFPVYAEPEDAVVPDKAFLKQLAREEADRKRRAAEDRATRLLAAQEANRETFLDNFTALIDRRPVPIIQLPYIYKTGERKPRSLILFLSDIHAGQLMAEASGLNLYDLAVMNERVNRLVESVLEITADLRAGGPVDHLVIVWGGDILDGRDIHPGHDWQSIPLVDQLDGGGQILIHCLLNVLAGHFKKVSCRVIPGNHGRIGKKGQLQIAGDNVDMLLGRYMMRLTEHIENISWSHATTWFSIFKLQGHNFVAAHGDAFKAFSGIPFYGAARYLQRLTSMFHIVPDALMVGHHHNAAAFPQGWSNIVMNGSMVGTGEFGAFLGYSGPPIQKLLLVSEKHAVATQFDLILSSRQEMVTAEFDDLDAA